MGFLVLEPGWLCSLHVAQEQVIWMYNYVWFQCSNSEVEGDSHALTHSNFPYKQAYAYSCKHKQMACLKHRTYIAHPHKQTHQLLQWDETHCEQHGAGCTVIGEVGRGSQGSASCTLISLRSCARDCSKE